jgi:hypothetical protein
MLRGGSLGLSVITSFRTASPALDPPHLPDPPRRVQPPVSLDPCPGVAVGTDEASDHEATLLDQHQRPLSDEVAGAKSEPVIEPWPPNRVRQNRTGLSPS